MQATELSRTQPGGKKVIVGTVSLWPIMYRNHLIYIILICWYKQKTKKKNRYIYGHIYFHVYRRVSIEGVYMGPGKYKLVPNYKKTYHYAIRKSV